MKGVSKGVKVSRRLALPDMAKSAIASVCQPVDVARIESTSASLQQWLKRRVLSSELESSQGVRGDELTRWREVHNLPDDAHPCGVCK